MRNDNLSIFRKIRIPRRPVNMNSNIYARKVLVKRDTNVLLGKKNKRFNKFNTETPEGIRLAHAAKWIGLALLKKFNMVYIEDHHIKNLFDGNVELGNVELRNNQQDKTKNDFFNDNFFNKAHYFNLKESMKNQNFKNQWLKYRRFVKFNPVNYSRQQKIERYDPSKSKDNCSTSTEHNCPTSIKYDIIKRINEANAKRICKTEKIKSRVGETIIDKIKRLQKQKSLLFNKNSKTRNQINNTAISNVNQQCSRSKIMM